MEKEEKITFYKMTEEQWQAFVGEKEIYNLSRKEFSKNFPGLYVRGSKLGLINQMYPNENSNSIMRMSREQIIAHGKQKGYDKLTRTHLYDKDPYYYNTIIDIGGIEELIPKPEKIAEEKAADPDKKVYGVSKETIAELMKRHIEEFMSKGKLPKYFWKYLGKKDFEFIIDKENYQDASRGDLGKKNPTLYQILLKRGYLRQVIKKVRRHLSSEAKKTDMGQLFLI